MEPILKDLCVLIRKSTIHYNEACPQGDVSLSESFQEQYRRYLEKKNYSIDYYKYTSVITTSAGLYIFLSNQWFVVASYAVGIFSELMKYKYYAMKICDYMGEKPKKLIPRLRDSVTIEERERFFEGCKIVFDGYDNESIELASRRLWRFVTDYMWWSGSKTIDRGDFYYSVILNMLNLVNASQSYIGEIVSDFVNSKMVDIVSDLSLFTEEYDGATFNISDYSDPKEDNSDDIVEINDDNIIEADDDDDIVISVRTRK
ncbi:MAG: hypothetical protein ACI4UK_09085 [Floccifex sp.]